MLFKIFKTFVNFMGGELDKLQVPMGGDQLTRVRLEWEKTLRKGAQTANKDLIN